MKNIILSLLLGFSSIAFCQLVTIKDKETNSPIDFVTLTSDSLTIILKTDINGQVNINAFENFKKINIYNFGYKSITKSYQELKELNFNIYLETAIFKLDEVVISATRWTQKISDVPAKIVTISSKEVALQNPQTAADLLGVSGKVYIQKSQQGGGSPIIRGFATNRLLYTVDGIRMNTAIFRGGNIQNVISLDPFATQNTEVFLGANSIIYGSDAIGGVMNFQTLTPELSWTSNPLIAGKVISRYSLANSEQTGHFDINIGWKKIAFITSFSSFKYDDLRMGSNGPDDYLKSYYIQRQDSVDVVVANNDSQVQRPSAYSQMNMMQKIRFKPSDKLDIQYAFHYSETSDYGRYDRSTRLQKGLPRYAEWNYGPQKWMMNNLSINYVTKTKIYDQLTIRLAQQSFEESRISRVLNNDLRSTQMEEVQAYSANLDLTKKIDTMNTLSYGIEYILNDVNSIGEVESIKTNNVVGASPRYPKSTWQSMAVYVNDQYKFSDKFLIQAGLRYNQFILNAQFDTTFYSFPFTETKLNNGALTGSVGSIYRPVKNWIFSANFSTAFRSPNVDDIGKVFDSQPGSVVIPNPNLKAEYAYSIDMSVKKVFDDWLEIDLTGYYTLLENALVRRNFTLNNQDSIIYDNQLSQVQAIQNAATAIIYGLEAGIEIELPKGFSFSSDFNYQKGQEELDNGDISPSRHAVPWFGTTRLKYSANKLNLQLYTTYQGERKFENLSKEEQSKINIYALDGNGNPYAPSWYTLNFKTMYQFSTNFIVSAGIENVTDQRYRSYSSGISGAGRNFILSLKAKF